MSAHEADRGPLRIGELSRRVGVTPEVLRAWERGYGVLSPTRTDGGFRLYGEDDERRIRRMLQHLEQGLSAAEAARLARADPPARLTPPPEQMTETAHRRQLRSAGSCAMRLTDSTTSARIRYSTGSWGRTRWRAPSGMRSFPTSTSSANASRTLRHRSRKSTSPARCSAAVCSPWPATGGAVAVPHALLACVPGDQHNLGLICFGLALHAHGWRITYLGADLRCSR